MPTVMVSIVQATYSLATFVHISNVSAVTSPTLTKLFGPIFWGVIIFVGQNVLQPNSYRPEFISHPKFLDQQFYWTQKIFQTNIFSDPKFFQAQNFSPDQNFFLTQNLISKTFFRLTHFRPIISLDPKVFRPKLLRNHNFF